MKDEDVVLDGEVVQFRILRDFPIDTLGTGGDDDGRSPGAWGVRRPYEGVVADEQVIRVAICPSTDAEPPHLVDEIVGDGYVIRTRVDAVIQLEVVFRSGAPDVMDHIAIVRDAVARVAETGPSPVVLGVFVPDVVDVVALDQNVIGIPRVDA